MPGGPSGAGGTDTCHGQEWGVAVGVGRAASEESQRKGLERTARPGLMAAFIFRRTYGFSLGVVEASGSVGREGLSVGPRQTAFREALWPPSRGEGRMLAGGCRHLNKSHGGGFGGTGVWPGRVSGWIGGEGWTRRRVESGAIQMMGLSTEKFGSRAASHPQPAGRGAKPQARARRRRPYAEGGSGRQVRARRGGASSGGILHALFSGSAQLQA